MLQTSAQMTHSTGVRATAHPAGDGFCPGFARIPCPCGTLRRQDGGIGLLARAQSPIPRRQQTGCPRGNGCLPDVMCGICADGRGGCAASIRLCRDKPTGCAVPVAGSAPWSCAVRLQDHCYRPSKGRRDASEPLRLAADPDQGGGGGDTSGRGSGTNPSRFGIRTSSKLRRSSTCVSGTISLRNRTYATTA